MKARYERQAAPAYRALSGQALLDDMDEFRKEVASTPENARDFLKRLGVLTKDGKRRDLIRD